MARSFEGTKKDIKQDRKMARKMKMKLQDWENSPMDEAHDAKEAYASGGRVRGGGAATKGLKTKVC